jgi:DEAD/DEAH box helicase
MINPLQILVATPCRLLDHIENKTRFSVRLMGLKMLVLDEADHLLDLGFRKDIEQILIAYHVRGNLCCSQPQFPRRCLPLTFFAYYPSIKKRRGKIRVLHLTFDLASFEV